MSMANNMLAKQMTCFQRVHFVQTVPNWIREITCKLFPERPDFFSNEPHNTDSIGPPPTSSYHHVVDLPNKCKSNVVQTYPILALRKLRHDYVSTIQKYHDNDIVIVTNAADLHILQQVSDTQ